MAVLALLCILGAVACGSGRELSLDGLQPRPSIAAMQSQVSVDNLRATVRELESFGERYSPENQAGASDYLVGRLEEYGLETTRSLYSADPASDGEAEYSNVVATLRGTRESDHYFVLGGHYDSKGSDSRPGVAPGANDNGTGVAVLLETARLLAGTSCGVTVRFVFFSNEEQGLLGSKHYAESIDPDAFRGAFVVDTVGFERDDGKIEIAAIPKSEWLVRYAERAVGLYGETQIRTYVRNDCACGDEHSFWSKGLDAAIFIDDYPLKYVYVHTRHDTMDKVNFDFVERVAKAVVTTIGHLADCGLPAQEPAESRAAQAPPS